MLDFDHHCGGLNNCVGRHNRKAFVVMLFYAWVGAAYGTYAYWWSGFGSFLLREHAWPPFSWLPALVPPGAFAEAFPVPPRAALSPAGLAGAAAVFSNAVALCGSLFGYTLFHLYLAWTDRSTLTLCYRAGGTESTRRGSWRGVLGRGPLAWLVPWESRALAAQSRRAALWPYEEHHPGSLV